MLLKSCCCGIPLRKGTVYIGIFTFVVSLLSFIVWTTTLVLFVIALVADNTGVGQAAFIIIIVSASISVIVSIIHFAMAIVLIRGAQLSKPRNIQLYLIYGTTMIVLSLISTLITAVGTIAMVFPVLVSLALNAYFLLVIRSFHKELLAEINGGGVISVGVAPEFKPSDNMQRV